MQPLWYRNATIYQVDPALFLDPSGDGGGTLAGVTERLDHLRDLGADTMWLLPFYGSPRRDNGYDVTDHLAVDPRLGDLGDVADLLDRADMLGIRVLIDLVAQHTSVDHPWFQEARHDPRSPYRDYYVWSPEPVETEVDPVFPTVEDSVWAWDDEAQLFYRHCFYSHMPDLEIGNPRVQEEVRRIVAFWLRLGIGGFRVDAVPYLIERARNADPREDGLWFLGDLRRFVALRQPEAVLMGEVDVPPDRYDDYLADDRRLTMLLDFWKTNHLFLALAREDAEPVVRALKEEPAPGALGQYANFLRNHDELDLERLSESEQEEVLAAFAPDPDMRVFGAGIRRRLTPMLGYDEGRVAMAHALLLSLPGTPVLLYGDEVGLRDDLDRPERESVRTSMDWAEVDRQGARSDSLLARVTEMVRARSGSTTIGPGRGEVVDVGTSAVLCVRHEHEGQVLLTAVNLSGDQVECDLGDRRDGALAEVLSDHDYPPLASDATTFTLGRYGYRWFRRRG